MSLHGPILLVADRSDGELAQAFSGAGAFPVVETGWGDAFKAAIALNPSVIVAAEPDASASEPAHTLALHMARTEPFVPLIVRMRDDGGAVMPHALPVAEDAPAEKLLARVSAALRIRTLHATVLARARSLRDERDIVADTPAGDPLDDATVLVVGRGRFHPTLSVAVGERMGVMGALSTDAAARCLMARDIDAIVIGDGLSTVSVEAFLTLLAEDPRFRELPVAVLGAGRVPDLPNLVQAREPMALLARAEPLIRLRAFEAALKRLLQSIECKGMLDPRTGLLHADAFAHALDHAIADATERGSTFSLARFAFEEPVDRRTAMDAARLVSRLVRDADFACRQDDGSILFVFADTDLRSANVVARRLASVLKHTMLRPGHDRPPVSPAVTLAALKPADTALSLMSRVAPGAVAAA